jgi:predicted nucleic acid-binding protein
LFGKVLVPDAVHSELFHPTASVAVRDWITGVPAWLEVTQVNVIDDVALQALDAGERDAIALALSLHADLILIDERKGTAVALSKGFEVIGTLGILSLAARFDRSRRCLRSTQTHEFPIPSRDNGRFA